MQQDGVAILLVSHSANTIIEFCDRAAYLDHGRLVAVGGCREVIERYTNDLTSSEARIATKAQAPVVAVPGNASTSSPAEEIAATEIVAVQVTDADSQEKSCFVHGDEIRVSLDLVFRRANPAPCFGIQLKSTDDIALWATSTAYMNRHIAPVEAGARLRFTWRLRANVGGSRFVIAVGAGDNASGEYRRHARLSYAGHFDVLPAPGAGAGWLDVTASFDDDRD
jgi:lipopolysaccharide transport system ATP-binding protein